MGSTDFFISWALWQQMTFVLACGIVLVMIAGMIKLWCVSRRVKKIAKLDEEKKSRLSEMRSSGLAVNKRNEIPFGVRAIQSGVEVDGIWISRPNTPTSESPLLPKNATSSPLAKGKERAGEAVAAPRVLTPKSPTATNFNTAGSGRSPGAHPQSTYRPRHVPAKPSPRANESYNADALNALEGSSSDRPTFQTYMPTTSHPDRSNQTPYNNASRDNEYPEYFNSRDPRDPFATPEPSERSSPPDHTSPFERVYTSEVQSSRAQPVEFSTADASRVDLESGTFSLPANKSKK